MRFLLPPILVLRRGVPRCVPLHHHPSKKDLPRFDLTFKPPAYHFERHRSSVALSGSITQVRKQWLDTPDTKQGAIAIRGAYSTSCIPSAISGSKLNLLTCGGLQNLSMICRHCQDYIPEDSRFCPRCGVRLKDGRVAPQRPWPWIAALLLFALIWSVMARKELQVELLHLRAQVDRVVDAF